MRGDQFRDEFDLDPGLIYLNSGSHSICPRLVIAAVEKYQREAEKNPTTGLFLAWERLWAVQKKIAEFFKADAQNLFLRANVTTVLNTFIMGIPLDGPGEILVTDLEYGAIVNACRYRAEQDGLSLRTFVLPTSREIYSTLSEDSLVQQIVLNFRPNTKMLLISHVMTANGLVIPIAKLAKETRQRGIILIVDGAHGPGALPLDFSRLSDVDYYAGNFHKWFMGPKGTGFGWVPGRHQKALKILEPGWTTYDVPSVYQTFGSGSVFQTRFMISASHNFAPFYALNETLEFWKRHGAETIFARLGELSEFTSREADRILGWKSLSPPPGPLLGPLISWESPDIFSDLKYNWMLRLLREYGLQVATPPVRGKNALRISPHIYNTEEEITRGLEILRSEVQKFK